MRKLAVLLAQKALLSVLQVHLIWWYNNRGWLCLLPSTPVCPCCRYTYEGAANFKRNLARLRGGLRRLNVRDPDDYDDEEYSEAANAVFEAAQLIARNSR